jgi:predicted nucleic acid-binding protein
MYLLDTCVISDLVSSQPTDSVVSWIDAVEEERLFLSVITIGEVKRGIDRLPVSARRRKLQAWLEQDLLEQFRGRIIPIGVDVMLTWGTLYAELERAGKKLPAVDSMIAATARRSNFVLVTRNVKDFAITGVEIIDPWSPG